MEKLLIILLLSFFSQSLVGQNNSMFQFELGTGMNNSGFFQADYAQAVNVNGTLRYQLKSLALGLRYEHAISTIGIDGPTELYPSYNGVRGRESEFSNYKSLQLRFDYCPNFESFKPIFGVGVSRVFLDNEVNYYDDYFHPVETPDDIFDPEKRRYYTMVFHFGYRVRDIRYGITVLPADGKGKKTVVGTSVSYAFGLSKRKSAPKYELSMYHKWKSRPLLLRLEAGRSLLVPVQNYYAASARYFFSALVHIGNDLYLGVSYEEKGSRMGFDKNTVDVQFISERERYYVRKTDISTSISARKAFIHKFKSIGKNVDFYYGGGVGIYKIDEVGESQRYDVYYPPEIEESSNWGLLISTGVRTGWFNNRLELNIPIGKIPVYIGLQTAIGLQIRKREERGNGVIEMSN